MRRQRVLVVDDEPGIRDSLYAECSRTKATRSKPSRTAKLLRKLAERLFDLVLLDVWLPGIDGMETLTRIQEIPVGDRPMVIMISGHGSIETAVKATNSALSTFFEKPLTIEKVTVLVKNALSAA